MYMGAWVPAKTASNTPDKRAFHVGPHFHFETLSPNLWIVAIINIHAGVKISPFSSCSMLP
jgi:hypothetical protein